MVVVVFNENECELRCLFCRLGGELAGGKDFTGKFRTDLEQVTSILKQGIKNQPKGAAPTGCILTGSDPLASPVFFDIVKGARGLGYRHIRLNSSGMRLASMPLVRKLARCGVNKIDLPIYGSGPGVHDRITGVKGSYAVLMEAIRNIKACTGINLELLHTIMLNQNLDDIPGICAKVRKDFDCIVPFLDILLVRSQFDPGKGADFLKICPSLSEVRRVLSETPPGPYGLQAIPPCACPPHLAWPGGSMIDTDRRTKVEGPPWTSLKRSGTPTGHMLAPGYRLGRPCGKCVMKKVCPGVHESYLEIYGDGDLNPKAACITA